MVTVNRSRDWWAQALRDLVHARHALEDGDHEWAAFAVQQSAEKAVKAVIQAHAGEPWGHLTTALVEALPGLPVDSDVLNAARRLDKHHVPACYPNGFAAGYPRKLYTAGEAHQAMADAEAIIACCRGRLPFEGSTD